MIFHIALFIVAIGGVFSFTRQAQMLQQNSYFISRYFRWLKGEFTFRAVASIVFFAITVTLFLLDWEIPLLILSSIVTVFKIYYARLRQKASIKPLVYTARVKRQYFTASLLLLIFSLMGALLFTYSYFFTLVLSFFPCLTVIVVKVINQPIEFAITNWYINDAKKKLKAHKNVKVIGITGSYGKTSTKYVLAEFLQQKFNVVFTPQSFNTPLGVVITIRNSLKGETGILIAEMGAKNVGDIKEICDIVNPDIGIITSVGPQHLDTFGSIENVTNTKFELADSVLSKGGEVFLNTDNEIIRKRAETIDCITYGENGEFKAQNITYSPLGAQFDIVHPEGSIHIKTKLLGLHNVLNITAAAAVAIKLGVKEKDIAFAAARLKPVSHRLEMKAFIGGSTLLDDAYNANPVGSIAAVEVLSQFEGMKKVIVTPGLVELGDKEYECNYNLGVAAAKVCDTMIFVGPERAIPMEKAAKDTGFKGELHIVKSFKEAMGILSKIAKKDTVILFENDLPDNYSK